jgi:uncharacterized membrane protein
LERIVAAVACGVVAGAVVALLAPWQFALLVGWSVAAVVVLAWIWGHVWKHPYPTPAGIEEELEPEHHARWWFLAAGLASLSSVVLALIKSGDSSGSEAVLLNIGSVVTIALSWAVIQVEFMLRYAAEYYKRPEGGIGFPGPDEHVVVRPSYLDFAYVAFTIGMTYQVSDTTLKTRGVRKVVLRHALLSFVFGVVILGTTVNLIADLLRN